MRAFLPSITGLSEIGDNLRRHQPEVAVFSGMLVGLSLIAGGALSVLFSPNLGEQLTFPSILKPGSLQKGRVSMFGNTLLELSRPLNIEIVEDTTSDQLQGRGSDPTHASFTIISPAEFQPQLLRDAHHQGTRLLLLILMVGGGLYAVIRLSPYIPLGPKRRKPLGERLAESQQPLPDHPLAVKPGIVLPNVLASDVKRRKQAKAKAFVRFGEGSDRSRDSALNLPKKQPISVIPPNVWTTVDVSLANPKQSAKMALLASLEVGNSRSDSGVGHLGEQSQQEEITMLQTQTSRSPAAADWLEDMDVRQEAPLTSIM